MQKRILNISYHFGLAKTREALLEHAGFSVATAMSYADALRAFAGSTYDLVILGHTIGREDKERLIREIKLSSPGIPLLSLRRHDTPPAPEVDHSLEASEGPAALLEMIENILNPAERRLA